MNLSKLWVIELILLNHVMVYDLPTLFMMTCKKLDVKCCDQSMMVAAGKV